MKAIDNLCSCIACYKIREAHAMKRLGQDQDYSGSYIYRTYLADSMHGPIIKDFKVGSPSIHQESYENS